jgi:iron complex transport system substrate-binding protein
MGQTLRLLGAKNILPAQLGPFPKVNPEFVVKANPDVVMISQKYASTLAQRPGWAAMRALRDGRVCAFSEEEADILVRPGPRMPEAARLMARCLADKF